MAKTNPAGGKKKRGFLIFTLVYALVFLVAAAIGLRYFWNFIDAYEQSRPMNPVKAYVAELTYETVQPYAEQLIAQIDPNLQSRESGEAMIREVLSSTISYSKLGSESNEVKQVFVLRSGPSVIGRMTIEAGEPDRFGFSHWEVTQEEYDFSYLMGESVSLTVPESYSISVNGQLLDESYITESGIVFPLLEDFYERYPDLPTMVTYTMGPCLGDVTYQVLDGQGNPTEITEDTDLNLSLNNCSDAEAAALDRFVSEFLTCYVAYTGSSERNVYGNYGKLSKYLVQGSDLQERLLGALAGLIWAQSMGDQITDIDVHYYIKLDATHYLCDLTYLVNTTGSKGVVETVNNVRIVITETATGLKAEALSIY